MVMGSGFYVLILSHAPFSEQQQQQQKSHFVKCTKKDTAKNINK